MTQLNRSYEGSRTCECTHIFEWHKEALDPFTAFGPGFGDCKGLVGSHTPNTIRPCECPQVSALVWTVGRTNGRAGQDDHSRHYG